MQIILSPSILSADFSRLGEECEAVLTAGADHIHFDVMDNHYVPNLTIGPCVLASLRKAGLQAPVDVHLMSDTVDPLIEAFAQAGASSLCFHPEATLHVDRSLSRIKSLGCQAGLAFNPTSSLAIIDDVIDKIDFILIMSVNPGFGGQSFIPSSLKKIEKAEKIIQASGRDITLAVDGGINQDTIKMAYQAGARHFVAGAAIFSQPDYKKAIQKLKAQCVL